PSVAGPGRRTAGCAGLRRARHAGTRRFGPEAASMLGSESTVMVRGAAEPPAGGADDDPAADADGAGELPSTGGDPTAALLLALGLMVGAGAMFSIARMRRAAAGRS